MGMYTGSGMYTGQGEYSPGDEAPTTNDLVEGGAPSVAQFASTGDETGALAISNREYLGDVFGNALVAVGSQPISFTKTSYILNPGLEKTFPWLSQIASNYEEYEFKQLMFTYKSTVQDINSNNGQVGTAIMTTTYNANASDFPDKASMMQYAHSSSMKVTDDGIHGVECDPSKLSGSPGKFIRSGNIDVTDLNTYDYGKFQLGIANTPSSLANNAIGELWVSYTLILRKPKIVTNKGLTISRFLAVTRFESNPMVAATSQFLFGSTLPAGSNTKLNVAVKNSLDCLIRSAASNSDAFVPSWLIQHYSFNAKNTTGLKPSDFAWGDAFLTAAPSCSLTCQIPAYFSGALELKIRVELNDTTLQNELTGAILCLNPPIFFGNIKPINDLYANGNGTTTDDDNPVWFTRSPIPAMIAATSRQIVLELTCHVYVTPATSTSDNGFYFKSYTGAGGINEYGYLVNRTYDNTTYHTTDLRQASLELVEYNSSLNKSLDGGSVEFVQPDGQRFVL